jgi:mono/diheme cytochrome c family protein
MQQKRLLATLLLFSALTFIMVPSVSMSQGAKKGVKKGVKTKKGGKVVSGAKVFAEHCTTCHEGGNNTIEKEKTLKLPALKANGFKGPADIKQRVREGKGIMPAFAEEPDPKLKPEEIDAVANYVWGRAQKGWK